MQTFRILSWNCAPVKARERGSGRGLAFDFAAHAGSPNSHRFTDFNTSQRHRRGAACDPIARAGQRDRSEQRGRLDSAESTR